MCCKGTFVDHGNNQVYQRNVCWLYGTAMSTSAERQENICTVSVYLKQCTRNGDWHLQNNHNNIQIQTGWFFSSVLQYHDYMFSNKIQFHTDLLFSVRSLNLCDLLSYRNSLLLLYWLFIFMFLCNYFVLTRMNLCHQIWLLDKIRVGIHTQQLGWEGKIAMTTINIAPAFLK